MVAPSPPATGERVGVRGPFAALIDIIVIESGAS
jgi:hypothetical protein